MLEPNNRSLLTEMLQPPRGYSLAQAVGTTFTLDLATALSIPLSFASRNLAAHDDVGILAALAQYSDRITIFTQAGHISSGMRSELVALLEEVIHPVNPTTGIFHPKVWFLEFEKDDDVGNQSPGSAAREPQRAYRFLCLSRNLTEDRSWDLSVRLDGKSATPANHDECTRRNQPLVDLLTRLPEMSISEVPAERTQQIHGLAGRVSSVNWELPPGITDLEFHLLDASDDRLPNGSAMFEVPARDVLAISPFVTAQGMHAAFGDVSQSSTLISRPDAIDQLPTEALQTGRAATSLQTFVLDDLLTEVEGTEAGTLSGLHAKAVFLRERRYSSRSRALIGSANLTGGGLHRNVELMVELHGHTRQLGPEKVLESLRSMLEPYPSNGGQEASDVEVGRQALAAQLRQLAVGKFHLEVTDGDPYGAEIWCEPSVHEKVSELTEQGIELTWALHTQKGQNQPMPTHAEERTELRNLQLAAITPFLQLTATQRIDGTGISASTIVSAELHHDVPGRRDAVLARGIADSEAFFKLLALLLNTGAEGIGLGAANGEAAGQWGSHAAHPALFESLLRSLARGDDGLEVVQRILAEIQNQSEGEGQEAINLPEGFTELWANVWAARQSQLQSGKGKKGATS